MMRNIVEAVTAGRNVELAALAADCLMLFFEMDEMLTDANTNVFSALGWRHIMAATRLQLVILALSSLQFCLTIFSR